MSDDVYLTSQYGRFATVMCVDRMVFGITFRCVFTVFLQLVMVVTVSMDTNTVIVSVRIKVSAAITLKRHRATSFRCPLQCMSTKVYDDIGLTWDHYTAIVPSPGCRRTNRVYTV